MNTLDSPKNDAWRYITGVYAKPGVEAACLQLQDRHGVNVTFLLFLKWCEATGRGGSDDWQAYYAVGRGWRFLAGLLRAIRRTVSGKAKRFLMKQETACEKRQLQRLAQAAPASGGAGRQLTLSYLAARGAADTGAAKTVLDQ